MAAPGAKRRACVAEPTEDDVAMGEDPFSNVVAVSSDPLNDMGNFHRVLCDIQLSRHNDALHRETELLRLQTEARGYTRLDERESSWVFQDVADDWAFHKTATESTIGFIVAATESIRIRMSDTSGYDPLDPRLYSMAVVHEEDLAGAMSDVMPPMAKPVWKAAAASIDTFIWALLRFIIHVGRQQGLRLVTGFYSMDLRRQPVRYEIPLHHRLAIAAMYVDTVTQPMFTYAMGGDAGVRDCVQTWYPQMASSVSRVDCKVWRAALERLLSDVEL